MHTNLNGIHYARYSLLYLNGIYLLVVRKKSGDRGSQASYQGCGRSREIGNKNIRLTHLRSSFRIIAQIIKALVCEFTSIVIVSSISGQGSINLGSMSSPVSIFGICPFREFPNELLFYSKRLFIFVDLRSTKKNMTKYHKTDQRE